MQKSMLVLTFFFVLYNCSAQYYYNDVVSVKESNRIYQLLKKNNVQEISATSKEADNTPTPGFVYLKTLKNNGSLVVTHTELETGGTSDDYDTYSNDLLTKSSDSADNILTNVEYTYDNAGNTLQVQTQSEDTAMDTHNLEIHKWFYTGNIPDSMMRIKDKTDTTFVHFKKDEHQNITEELWMKRGRMIEHYFYYYNDNSQLTDIVRYNIKAKKLLPDYVFEYNDNGIISSLTQVPQGSSDYIVWQYLYDERGLKTRDVLFDKHQQLLGTVTYTYR